MYEVSDYWYCRFKLFKQIIIARQNRNNNKSQENKFLHYLLNRSEEEMISQVFRVQWSQPDKNDWILLVQKDLMDFNIEVNLSYIKRKSKLSFKNLVKMRAHEYEFTQSVTG